MNEINDFYLDKDVMSLVKKDFNKKGFVVLDNFFNNSYCSDLKRLNKLKFKESFIWNIEKFSFIKDHRDFNFLSDFLETCFGIKIKLDFQIKRFSHRDFTLRHDSVKLFNDFYVWFYVCNKWDESFGGYRVFEIKGKQFIFNVKPNRICIVKGDKKINNFVKYVNCFSGKNSFLMVGN